MSTISVTKAEPQNIGSFIDLEIYRNLSQNFKNSFPNEVNQVLLAKPALKTILQDTAVSGIKFMNGLEIAGDPLSRILVLIPGNYTHLGSLPNSIIKSDGFLTNTGNNISLEKTWQVLFNHVLHFKKIDINANYTKINRGSFMGREILTNLINQTEGDTLIYHFGYDIENNYPYKALIQAGTNAPITGDKVGDRSHPCPGSAGCPKSLEEMCALTRITTSQAGNLAEGQLNVLRSFRDRLLKNSLSGAEIEKYYTISASLLANIDMEPNPDIILKGLYDTFIKPSLNSLANDDEATAYTLFREALDHLTENYLYQ